MEKEEETMAPVKTGMAVYALFKWLALTLRQDENKDIYTFPFHAIQEYNLDNVGSELNYHRFVSRIRRYAAEHLSLPSKRMPLFIHAIGLLDAFMLVQCFKQWQKIYKRNKQLDDYFIVNYCRLLLRSWARKTACKKRLQRAASLVHLKTQVRSIMHFFYLWRRNYHNNRMVRKHWLPRRRALAFEEFSQRVNKIKIGRCQFHLSICHHVTYRLGHYFGLLRSQRCALSGATELIASIAVIDLIVQAIKSQNLGFDYLVHRSESRIYERQRFFRILLNSWQDRSTPSTTSATKKTGGIYQIIRILHTELHSRQGRQALELLGDRYYRARCRQRAMRQWLARHIQCVVDYHHIAQSSPITMDISNETMQRLNSHFLHLPRAHLYGPRYFEANKFRLTKQLSYLFHKWWRRHQVQSYQEYAFHKVYRRTMTQIQGQAFANWLILAAKNRVYRQVSHQILHKTYYRRLLVSFYQWRNQYERMVLIKTNQKELLRQRDQEVKSFTALMTQKHHHHLKYAILRSWFLFVKDRNKGKRVLLLWLKYANAAKVRAAWTCWKTVTSLATIVTCMKKLWLGYRTRFLSHGRIYQYMRWYRQQYRLLQCFQRRWNKKKVWSVFQKYRLLLDHEFIKKRYERNIYRAFKKFFQFYRQRRLKHQVERKGMAYFQHTRPQLLLQRWKQRVVAGRLFHHTHLQYYRQLLSRTLRRLQANAKYYHRQYLAYRMGKEKVWWYFLAKINQRLDQRMLQRLGRVHERHRVLKPCLQFWYAWSQRRCRALYYRRKSLYRRRRGYFLQWKEQMQCKAQQRQISQLFHAKMSQWRYLHHWQDYLQNSVYHKVWKGVQKHEKDRHFGYQPNTANSSRYRFLTFPATQRPNSKLPMNLTYYPSLIQGCIAHYFRRAFHHYHQHALVLRSLRKSMLRAGHHHHRYQLRRAFGYFWAQYKRASMRPGYEKKRLIPSRFGAGSGGSSGLGGVGRMYLHLRHGNYGGARRIQRLRRLWYDDPHQSSQLFYRLMKWQSFVQQRKKRQGNYKKLFRIYRREQMNRIFWKVLIRLRKLRKHRKILHNIYKYYFTNHVKLFFTRILERLKNKRWKRKRIMDHHYQRMRNVYKLCFRQLRSLTAQHCKTRKSFKFIRKLLIGSRLFFQRLRSKVYKNRYDRVTRIVQAKFRRHILRSFILFQRRLLQQQRQRQVKKLTAKNHQLNEKKKALVHWRVIALYQKKIQKINRRFLLVPYLKRWMEEYQLSNRYHKILSIMSKKVNTRIKSTFWIYWKIYITRKMRLSLQYNLVWKEHQLRAKHNVLTAWMSAMDNRLVYQKYLLVHALHAKHLKAFVLKEWYHLTLRHEIINFKNMKAVMVNWRYNLQRYRQQREHMQLANIFHYNRLVYKSFQVLRRQVRLRHRWQQREEYALRRSLRRLYLKYFRQWKRHMYIIYYHERKQRPSSTTRLPGSHLLGEKTSTAAVNMNEPRKHVWMSDVDDREGNGANNDSLHRSARRGRHKHYDRHDEDSQTGRGTMRASSLLRSRPDPHLTSRDTSTASATFNNRSMFSNSQQGGLRSPTAVHNTMEDGGGRGLSLSHLAATAASPLPRPRPRSSSHSHARPSSSNRQHHSSSPSRPFSPARVAHVLEQHDPPNAHYHHRLQQRYARLSRYQRLLQYDCDVSLWQPYRLFVHWRR